MLVIRPPRWKIFEAFDIPVYVDLSFLLLLFLFLNSGGSFSYGLMQAMVLGLSIVAHEYGHALTGRLFGCETHDINLSMIGGCASMLSMPRRGWQEFLVAIAGPLVSFTLCGIGFVAVSFLPIENDFSSASCGKGFPASARAASICCRDFRWTEDASSVA